MPKFTDSYFGETSFRSNDNVFNLTGSSLSSTHDENNETYDIFNELTEQRKKHPETFTCAYLNINSIRYKFCSIKQLLTTNTVDMLIIAETKIDNSFPDAQFKMVPNPVRPLSRFAPIPVRPGSFHPYSRSPRVVSPSFINSALKNEIWKIPLQIFVFWML